MPANKLFIFGESDFDITHQCSGNILTDEEQLATVLLVQNLSLCVPQTAPLSAYFWESEDGPSKISQEKIGAALGPWHTLFNPSCTPNAARVLGSRRILCHNLRPIKAGEQIFLSKGNVYTGRTREDRQTEFKEERGRECSCIACVENWPLLSELKSTRSKYLTSNKELIKKIDKMVTWISQKLYHSVAEEDLKKVIEFSKTIRRYVKEPSYKIILCKLFLCSAMTLKGNLYFSQKFIASLYYDLYEK